MLGGGRTFLSCLDNFEIWGVGRCKSICIPRKQGVGERSCLKLTKSVYSPRPSFSPHSPVPSNMGAMVSIFDLH